jgi:hypothetical protein
MVRLLVVFVLMFVAGSAHAQITPVPELTLGAGAAAAALVAGATALIRERNRRD